MSSDVAVAVGSKRLDQLAVLLQVLLQLVHVVEDERLVEVSASSRLDRLVASGHSRHRGSAQSTAIFGRIHASSPLAAIGDSVVVEGEFGG